MNLTHLHLLLNHFPTIGTIVAIGLYLYAFMKRNDDLKRAGLGALVVIATLSLPAFFSGYSAKEMLADNPDVPQDLVQKHLDMAFASLVVLGLTGALSWRALWQWRTRPPSDGSLILILVFAFVALGMMSVTAYLGGGIGHQDIRQTEIAITLPAWISTQPIVRFENGPWYAWATTETVHFIGLCLLAGSVLTINFRLIGVLRNVPFASVERLTPYAVLGLGINVVSGLAFYVGDPVQYDQNIAFLLKMIAFIPAVVTLLYVTLAKDVENIGADQKAPLGARLVGWSGLFLWALVLYFGRMLPYLGNAF